MQDSFTTAVDDYLQLSLVPAVDADMFTDAVDIGPSDFAQQHEER